MAPQVDVAHAGQQEAGDRVLRGRRAESERRTRHSRSAVPPALSLVSRSTRTQHSTHTSSPMTASREPSGGGPEEGSICPERERERERERGSMTRGSFGSSRSSEWRRAHFIFLSVVGFGFAASAAAALACSSSCHAAVPSRPRPSVPPASSRTPCPPPDGLDAWEARACPRLRVAPATSIRPRQPSRPQTCLPPLFLASSSSPPTRTMRPSSSRPPCWAWAPVTARWGAAPSWTCCACPTVRERCCAPRRRQRRAVGGGPLDAHTLSHARAPITSPGDAAGLGAVRANELRAAVPALLGDRAGTVTVVDDPALQVRGAWMVAAPSSFCVDARFEAAQRLFAVR